MVVRDRSEDKLNGELHSMRIDGSGSPQVRDFDRQAPSVAGPVKPLTTLSRGLCLV